MRKIITAILVMALLLTTLSGCGGEPAQAGADTGGALSIAAFFDSGYLELAARKYEAAHDGVTVTINVYATDEDRDIAKYSQIMNTALMSGGGEDIIDVGYIDWVTLAANGRLLDLNTHMDFAPGAYYQSALDAYIYDGGRYALPLSFYFTAFGFTDAFSDSAPPAALTLDGLITLADEYPENPVAVSGAGFGAVTLAHTLFNMDFYDYIDIKNKRADINNEKFISMLERVSYLFGGRQPIPENPAILREEYLYNPASCMSGIEDYTGMFLLTNDRGQGLYTPIGFLPAVNANSADTELAADFMRFLVSEEMQTSPELMFNPVNINASAEMAALMIEAARAEGYEPEGFDLSRNIALYNKLTEDLGVVAQSDSFISGFVYDELDRYFNGGISAEEAAGNLQSRLTTYLQE